MIYAKRIGLGLIACLMVLALSCGPRSTVGEEQDPAVLDYRAALGEFLANAGDTGFGDVDRDFSNCLAPSDPQPLATTVPDSSGHSRSRLTCQAAADRVVAVLPAYREVVQAFRTSGTDLKDVRIKAAHESVLAVHDARLRLYEEVASALSARDIDKFTTLRERYKTIESLSAVSTQALAALEETPPQ